MAPKRKKKNDVVPALVVSVLIVLATLGVLTAATMVGAIGGPQPSPTPTTSPTTSPSPTPTRTPTPTPTATPTPTPTSTPNPDVVWSDGFENGWSVWSHIATPVVSAGSGPSGSAGSTWSLQSSIVHSGNYAAKFTIPAESDAWANVYKTLDNYYPTLYASGWVMFNANIPVGSYLMLGPCLCGYNDHDLSTAYIYNDHGTLKWTLLYYTNSASDMNFLSSTLGPPVQNGVGYIIQTMVTTSNGAGEAAMWVNGVKIVDVTGLRNDGDRGPSGEIGALNLQVGPYDPAPYLGGNAQQAFAVTTWHDDSVASTRYILYSP